MIDALREVYKTLVCFTTILLACELMFCLPSLPRRERFWPRFAVAVPLYVLLLNSHLLVTPVSGTWFVSVRATAIFTGSVAVLWFLFDAPLQTALFYGAAGYSVEGILYVVRKAGDYFDGLPELDYVSGKIVAACCCLFVVLSVMLLLVSRYGEDRQPDVNDGFLLVFVLVTHLVANVLSTWVRTDGLQSAPYAVCSVMCYILLLMVQFGAFRMSSLERERDLERRLFRLRERQQRESRESVEVVNVKFHDLKHQIAALRQMEGGETRERCLEELEHSIEAYDASVRSGEPAVDAILTEKSTRCWSRGIDFSCMVDGPCLMGLGVVDLYTLLGNALDNAIEAAEKVPSWEARVVSVRAWSRGGLAFLCVENSCVGTVELGDDGLPATSKDDHDYHGFGLRSIRDVASRHGGNVTLDAEDGRFSLTVLLPLASGRPAELAG